MKTKTIYKYIIVIFLFLSKPNANAQIVEEINITTENKPLPFGLVQKAPINRIKMGVVLSGGGSRGIAHLGFLKVLEENKIPIEYIVGTSMGSIVGGLYASGYTLEKIEELLIKADWNSFYSAKVADRNDLFIDQKITEDRAILTFKMDGLTPIIPTSINSGQKFLNFLSLLSFNAPLNSKQNFDSLLYKFKAVSTDLVSGKAVVIDSGSIGKAMRASSGVSFLLAPVKIDSMLLVDGGLVANLPVKIAKQYNCNFILASNLTSPLKNRKSLNEPFNMADQILSVPLNIITKQNIDEADFCITANLSDKKNNDFTEINILIEDVYKSVTERIDKLKTQLAKLQEKLINEEIKEYQKELFSGKSNLEKAILQNFSSKIVTNIDIKRELQKYLLEGKYKNLSAKIIAQSTGYRLQINEEKYEVIKEAIVTGANPIIKRELFKIIKPLEEKEFNPQNILQKGLDILRYYRSLGYSLAEITSINFIDGILKFNVNEGIVKKIAVVGNSFTDKTVITREFPLDTNKVYKYKNLEKGLSNITASNLFEEVDLSFEKEGKQSELEIKVQEKISNLLRFGLHIDDERKTQISVDLRNENLFGSGTEIGTIFHGGLRNRNVILEHKANRIFNTYLTYKIQGFYNSDDIYLYNEKISENKKNFSRKKVGEYRQIKRGISLGIGANVQKLGSFIIEASYAKDKLKNLEDMKYIDEEYKIARVKTSLKIDSQNKYPFPTKGVLLNSYYETSQKIFSADFSYTKFYFDYSSHFTLGSIHTITPKFTIGVADETLPLSRQFSLGGEKSFFGMKENELRGRQIFLSSLNYRLLLPFKIFFESYFNIRYDIGAIWSEKEQIRFKDLLHGVGASLALDTPLGPATFSVGRSFKLKNDFLQYGETILYFTIGYHF